MSSNNSSEMGKNIDFSLVIDRVKSIAEVRSDRQLAEILGISQQNFSFRKRKGSLLPILVLWALNKKVDLNWLLKGESGEGAGFQSYKISDLLTKAAQILERGDHISHALAVFIEAHFPSSIKR